jgi:hypothetical protein
VQIVFDGGAHVYMRDGRRMPGTGIRALPAAVADDPEALEIAKQANRRQNVALGLALTGSACVGVNLVEAATQGAHPSKTEQGIFIGTLICEVVALIGFVPTIRKAQADELDAVNLYNEHRSLTRPAAPPAAQSLSP